MAPVITRPLPVDATTVIVDIWPRDNRSACFTDMTRTFVAGEPPAEVAEWHRLAVEWLELAVGLVRPGVTAKSVYDAVCANLFSELLVSRAAVLANTSNAFDSMKFAAGTGRPSR